MQDTLVSVQQGFQAGKTIDPNPLGYEPRLTAEGTSGTYILKDVAGQSVAVFKPIDEEAFAPNNPRGYQGKIGQEGFRTGVLSGEAASREVAAYLLDQGNFAKVPETAMVELQHPKIGNGNLKKGSLQKFVKSTDVIENYSSSVFDIDQLHQIAAFDLRILNLDRNDCNILVSGAGQDKDLTPIDHGLSLPDNFEINSWDLNFTSWKQADLPFSPETLTYIKAIDIMADVKMLEENLEIRPICLRNFRVSSMLL
jgi:hypothetical protein